MSAQAKQSSKLSLVNEVINQHFEASIKDASQIDPSYQLLWETMHGLILSGGKRLRPLMTLAAYEAFGGTNITAVLPIAAAQELLHFSLLIHDDVIDRDYTRYGTLNIAGQYKAHYSKYLQSDSDQVHFAHSAAILAGDLMISSAHQLIASSDVDTQAKIATQQLLALSIFEVAGGELLDTELSFVPYTDGDALKIARYKTAGYSFKIPLITGAKLAGANNTQIDVLSEYALSLGVAYQLVDDILGTFGEEATTGKSITSDITEGKKTFMVEQAISVMTETEKNIFFETFGNPHATLQDINAVKQLLISTGAKTKATEAINEYAESARASLTTLQLGEEYNNELMSLIHTVTERSY